MNAINLLRQLDAKNPRQPIPADSSLDSVLPAWRDYVIDEEGKITRRYYVGLDEEKIRAYIRNQEQKDRQQDQW